ncbi:MAG TPA: amidohydrolase family protein [Thermoanaerobaculia bacterium]
MRRIPVLFLLIALLAACAPPAGRTTAASRPVPVTPAPKAATDVDPWAFFFQETDIQRLIQELSARHRPGRYAVTGVTVIDVAAGERLADRTVLVSEGRIEAVAPAGAVRLPRGYARIDGRGRFLIPGLVDMHVHSTATDADTLLHLANGVTSVRDMCGFPWMLRLRERIRTGRVLMPDRFVAGHILNAMPMGMYATVVKTSEEARRVVREQKAAGYEFIKVHNVLPKEVYQAILDEAAKLEIRVVGHIPHDITVAEAIRGGQLTLEHFKGYILDRSLTLSDEDYVAATQGGAAWNCPTFYTYRTGLRGEEAKRLIQTAEEMRYVPVRTRRRWLEAAETGSGDGHEKVFHLSKKIFQDLLPIHPRLLAGTDSGGGYPHMVAGFALLDELRIMEELGLSPLEALRTATLNAAQALERPNELGSIEAGRRADLVLLDADPLLSTANLRHPAGVMTRGVWLDHKALDALLDRLAEIYRKVGADTTLDNPSGEQITHLIAQMGALARGGWIFKDHQLETLAGLLRERQREEDAQRVLALKAG